MIFRTIKNIIKTKLKPERDQELSEVEEVKFLSKIAVIECDTKSLGKISSQELGKIFADKDIEKAWQQVSKSIKELSLPEMTGGVNPGDQRAIFYLIDALKPSSVLEIGTHIGCSTVHIAAALKTLSETKADISFITVDVRDVNDPLKQPWKTYKSPYSPAELIEKIQANSLISFQVSPSLDFFQNNPEAKFDFIFLDGLHNDYMVYQEIPKALNHLNEGGLILLHDYFPDKQALWEGSEPSLGPYLGVDLLQKEGANLQIIPLGNLPWATKLGTNITSLALVSKP